MTSRFYFSLILLCSVIFAPFWLSALLALTGILVFPAYWEAVLMLFISDALFGTELERFYNFPFVSSMTAFFLFVLSFFIRKKIIFYS